MLCDLTGNVPHHVEARLVPREMRTKAQAWRMESEIEGNACDPTYKNKKETENTEILKYKWETSSFDSLRREISK